MSDMDFDEKTRDVVAFTDAIRAMFELFGMEMTRGKLHGYWLGLCDLPIASVQRAVARAVRTSDHLPLPVQLRRLAGGDATPEARAIAAWDDVLKATTCGAYAHLDFQDRIINATIRNLGGWPNFLGRFTDAKAEEWARKEFLAAYRAFASSVPSEDALRPLSGLGEATVADGRIVPVEPCVIECDQVRSKLPGPPAIAGHQVRFGALPNATPALEFRG